MKLAYTPEGFIDWPLILSYDAPFTLVIDARTRGKTFGLRYQCIRDYVKRQKRFVELARVAEFLKGSDKLQADYFTKYYTEYADKKIMREWLCDTQGTIARIAPRVEEGEKPTWDTLGYFLAINDAENIKRRSNSFKPTRRFIMDEALIDKSLPGARYRDYLPGEVGAVASIITSVTRENRNTPEEDRARLYLLGNAVDLTCPWLSHFGITDVPPYGFSWHFGKRCLLWYGPPDDRWAASQSETVGGMLLSGTDGIDSAAFNKFSTLDESFFGDVPKGADFSFGIVYRGSAYGVWCDMREGYYYVVPTLPKNPNNKPIYALTASDARPNYIQARRAQKSLKGFVDLYYAGIVRYKDHGTRAGFLEALSLFGVR